MSAFESKQQTRAGNVMKKLLNMVRKNVSLHYIVVNLLVNQSSWAGWKKIYLTIF